MFAGVLLKRERENFSIFRDKKLFVWIGGDQRKGLKHNRRTRFASADDFLTSKK